LFVSSLVLRFALSERDESPNTVLHYARKE
jgi:hypothetical protein